MKTCSRCGATKSFEEFYRSSTAGHYGYQARCMACCKDGAAIWAKANRERINARRRKPPRIFLTREQRSANHREQERARYANNKERIKLREANYKKRNPHLVNAIAAKRRAAKLKAAVPWANKFFLEEAYALAHLRTKVFGFEWHVDHTVPLQHPLVCGLHNEFNVQVVPESFNCSKQNSFSQDCDRLAYFERAKEVLA